MSCQSPRLLWVCCSFTQGISQSDKEDERHVVGRSLESCAKEKESCASSKKKLESRGRRRRKKSLPQSQRVEGRRREGRKLQEAAATEKVNWDIVKFGRVLKIEHVQADPLHIEMLAKKSGPGNHSAVTCIVTREVLEEEMGEVEPEVVAKAFENLESAFKKENKEIPAALEEILQKK